MYYSSVIPTIIMVKGNISYFSEEHTAAFRASFTATVMVLLVTRLGMREWKRWAMHR